jgi:hypothetical protein
MATQHQTTGAYRQWGGVGGGHQHGHPTTGSTYYQRYPATQAASAASTAAAASAVAQQQQQQQQQQQASYTPSSTTTTTYNSSNSVSWPDGTKRGRFAKWLRGSGEKSPPDMFANTF